jgi:hypothetical protein
METTHTPGPWKHDATWGLVKHGRTEICALHSGNAANAALIAAAPDMLETLESVQLDLGDLMRHGRPGEREQARAAWERVRQAIAKARGAA